MADMKPITWKVKLISLILLPFSPFAYLSFYLFLKEKLRSLKEAF